MSDLEVVVSALFALAVILKFTYVVVKAVRIVMLKVDPPMAGFDSGPEMEVPVLADSEGSEAVVSSAEHLTRALLGEGEGVPG